MSQKCAGVMFATHYGWTPGTGVWVLDGSKESHSRMDKVYKMSRSTGTPMTWNMHLKLAGAKYYDHCMSSQTPLFMNSRYSANNRRGGTSGDSRQHAG